MASRGLPLNRDPSVSPLGRVGRSPITEGSGTAPRRHNVGRPTVANVVARTPRPPTTPAFVGRSTPCVSKTSKPVRSCNPRLGRFDSGAAPLSLCRVSAAFARRVPVNFGTEAVAARGRSEPPCAVADRGTNVAQTRSGRVRQPASVTAGSALHDVPSTIIRACRDGPHRGFGLRTRGRVCSSACWLSLSASPGAKCQKHADCGRSTLPPVRCCRRRAGRLHLHDRRLQPRACDGARRPDRDRPPLTSPPSRSTNSTNSRCSGSQSLLLPQVAVFERSSTRRSVVPRTSIRTSTECASTTPTTPAAGRSRMTR